MWGLKRTIDIDQPAGSSSVMPWSSYPSSPLLSSPPSSATTSRTTIRIGITGSSHHPTPGRFPSSPSSLWARGCGGEQIWLSFRGGAERRAKNGRQRPSQRDRILMHAFHSCSGLQAFILAGGSRRMPVGPKTANTVFLGGLIAGVAIMTVSTADHPAQGVC